MDFAAVRRSMVENQLRTNRITSPVILEAMGQLPREAFVPETLAGIAYVDEDLPLGRGRFLVEPLVLAQMLQAAEPTPADHCLVVGGGAAYEAAVAAATMRSVVVVESDEDLARSGKAALETAGVAAIEFVNGPLTEGCTAKAPYNVILFCGAVAEVPETLISQIAEGGRLVAVIRDGSGLAAKGFVVSRIHGVVARREAFDASIPWLPGFEPQPGFVF